MATITTGTYKTRQGAFFIQPDGPATKPIYLGCLDADDLEEPKGDITLQQCFDELGNYETLGFTQASPDPVTTSLTTWIERLPNFLERTAAKGCPSAVYFHMRCSGQAGVFTNYERSFFFYLNGITNITRSNLVMRSDDEFSEQSFDLSGAPPVYSGFEWDGVRPGISETENLLAVTFCSEQRCQGRCGGRQDICAEGYATAAAAAATTANVLRTTDQGATWTATAAAPFAADEDVSAIVCFRIDRNTTRVLVARGTTDAGNPAEVAYSDDNGATWTNVNVGSTNAQFVPTKNSLFALSKNDIWLGTDDGYIYYSENAGVTWTTLDAGVTTTASINAIHFLDENRGFFGADGDVIAYSRDGGSLWDTLTATGNGDNILAVAPHTENFLFVTTSGGQIFVSFDGGTTWEERPFTDSSTGSVPDIKFQNQLVGVMIHNNGSGLGKPYTTINGGWDWEAVNRPGSNSGLNALYLCASDLFFAVGDTDSGTGYVFKGTAGQ